MAAVIDVRRPADNDVKARLELWLNCRACETAFPSGVQYGKLIEPFRLHMVKTGEQKQRLSWSQRQILEYIFPYRGRNKLAMLPARWLQWLGLHPLLETLPPRSLSPMQGMFPRCTRHS